MTNYRQQEIPRLCAAPLLQRAHPCLYAGFFGIAAFATLPLPSPCQVAYRADTSDPGVETGSLPSARSPRGAGAGGFHRVLQALPPEQGRPIPFRGRGGGHLLHLILDLSRRFVPRKILVPSALAALLEVMKDREKTSADLTAKQARLIAILQRRKMSS